MRRGVGIAWAIGALVIVALFANILWLVRGPSPDAEVGSAPPSTVPATTTAPPTTSTAQAPKPAPPPPSVALPQDGPHANANAPPPPRPPGGGTMPAFPWPPPRYSAFATIVREWVAEGSAPALGLVGRRLETAFDRAGYGERSYYWVPGGFALVSRIEQIRADATPVDPPARWAIDTPQGPISFVDVVPEAFWIFTVWTVALVSYAAAASHRLVRWPTGALSDEPRSNLSIFISYRRQDSRDTAGRILDYLRQAFEEERLFLDVDRPMVSQDYRVVIEKALGQADVVLAVIGPDWITASDREGRRRLLDPDDMVRIELETALHRDLRIVPVLVEGASMPGAQDLPPSLEPLSYRSALPVRPDPDFQPDILRLVAALREIGSAP
jgi:hypothetical protein